MFYSRNKGFKGFITRVLHFYETFPPENGGIIRNTPHLVRQRDVQAEALNLGVGVQVDI